MAKYKRVKGGEQNEKTGVPWTRPELEEVCDLYIDLDGKNIHENNPRIHELANKLGRAIRSVENQLLGFRKIATNDTGRKNFNSLIPLIWKEKNSLKFRVSSALKDIIGRDLITDDFTAVFELVKNSFDAYATRVDISFENIYSNAARIVIKDNGKGMDFNDLKNKWLFVAYSAKREGTEDDSLDYRDSIYKNRVFAGAKGIGRFSCDRLGSLLRLETTKISKNPKTHVLNTDWEEFENNLRDDFADVRVDHQIKNTNAYGLAHGTVLEISKLRSSWDRPKLLKLKDSLAKLINPNRSKGEQQFKIFIQVEEELQKDSTEDDTRFQVNGEVQNFIFETLGLKTTKIFASISEDGSFLKTELIDGGTLIYRITEKNNFKLLDNIDYTIYYLNKAAKITFNKRMGVSSKEYGHIFLYKNGFRVYPYGESGEDPLKIDARKTQGTNRFLGTRELIGQIEIFSETNELKETSSRGDGLIKTDTYYQLEDCFWMILKRLERYVVDVQHWGISIENDPSKNMNSRIANLISRLADSKNIVSFDYSKDILEKIEHFQVGSAARLVNNLKRIAVENNNNILLVEVENISKKIGQLQAINEEIEIEKNNIAIEKNLIEGKLELREKENELLKEASNDEVVELMTIEHHVNQATFRVEGYIKVLYEIADKKGNVEKDFIEIIHNIALENQKIASLVKFVKQANFDLLSSKVTTDLVKYIEQYVRNVYKNDRVKRINKQLVKNVTVEIKNQATFIFEFTPLEINIILDNLLDNSFKASATNVDIKILVPTDDLVIDYLDNGVGIDPKVKDRIFDFGVTTTLGSGIGLYHIRKIIMQMGGDISFIDSPHGANFILKIPKKKQNGYI